MSRKRASKPIKRFPRYPRAKDIGVLARQIWKRPKFKVRETPSTEFVFSFEFSLPERIRTHQHASYAALFASPRGWKRALKQSYREARYGSDRVRDLSERLLFRIFVKALGILFDRAKLSEGPYKDVLDGDAEGVLKAAKRRPLDRKRRLVAKRMARTYDKLFPQVKALRKFIGDSAQRKNNTSLVEAVEKQFPQEWVRRVTRGTALQNLPVIAGHDNRTESLAELQCTARQLTVGILVCLEREHAPDFDVKPNTILEDYLPLGRKLNKQAH